MAFQGEERRAMLQRLSVDFNTMMMFPDESTVLICYRDSQRQDDQEALAVLREGERYLLTDSDMEVEAVVALREYQAGWAWIGRPDWTTRRDIPCAGL
jgi:hypothetical protein